MLPSMGPESRKRVKTKPHLIIRIKEEWHFDEKAKQFVSEDGRRVDVKANLPSRSHVEYRVPKLAKARKGTLSKDEANMLRYFNVMLPAGSDPSQYLEVVKKWPCVKKADPPRDVRLPGQSGSK